MKKKTKNFCCSTCNSDDILFQVWVDEFDQRVGSGVEDGEIWCNECNEHSKSIEKKEVA